MGRILLAEDNAVNQQSTVGLLEKNGYSVVVATNGREAIAAKWESVDAILMDVEMPEMGGLEAALAIREREKATGRHVPIIAMTAHAMKGDRERCLAAGMDDYLTKPIQVQELLGALERHISQRDAGRAAVESDAPGSSAVFDASAALERVEGDRELLAELATLFEGESQRLLQEAREGIARKDAAAVERAARTLKGSVGNFAAAKAFAAAQELERLGRSGVLTQAPALYAALEAEIQQLREALENVHRGALK